jgi:hypothetical protein
MAAMGMNHENDTLTGLPPALAADAAADANAAAAAAMNLLTQTSLHHRQCKQYQHLPAL